ncbi:DUF3800 domain-containing protein [Sinorhizobium meliloti]|nr:DUF3800 domain-containing protein [Sinorhizobium meliloti]
MAKVIYMDESGVSPNDKVMIVVGIIVDADKQLAELESEIKRVVEPHT